MPIVLVYAIMLFSIICYVCQAFFSRMFSMNCKCSKQSATPVFVCLNGTVVSAVVFVVCAKLHFAPSPETWIFGIINGVVLFLYNMGIVRSSSTGPYSFQRLAAVLGAVVPPALFATLYWGDVLLPVNIIGIVLMLSGLAVVYLKGLSFAGVKKGYFFWIFLLMINNAAYAALLDAQQRVMQNTQRAEMLVISFAVSAVVGLLYLLIAKKGRIVPEFRIGKKAFLFQMISSTSAALAAYQLMILLGQMSSAILLPMNNGSVLVLSILLGRVALKEKINLNMVIGIVMILVSLVLLAV